MTTTQTPSQTCEEHRCDEVATTSVMAAHYDPDMDDERFRAIGWSRPVHSFLCDAHLEEWQDDDLTSITEHHPL